MGYGESKRVIGRPKIGDGAGDGADRKAAHISRRAMVPTPVCADQRRRDRLERDPVKWLRWYLRAVYFRPFERPHLQIIEGAMSAHKSASRFAVAAERGIGKSTILWGMVLYFHLSGKETYPICVPWADKAMKRAFRFWKMQLCFGERLMADYPEFCAPFAHSRGVPQRLATTWWEDNGSGFAFAGKMTGAQLTVGEGMIITPNGCGCIGGATVNGNVRGLNHATEDGRVIRPTMVLLDDVQDRDTAKSPTLVQEIVDMIDGDVAGCGEAGKDMAMLMSGNCILPDDVMAHYLDSREWSGLRIPCVEQWPDGWEDSKSATHGLWRDWYDIFLRDEQEAAAYYRKNKSAMVANVKLSAPGVYVKSNLCPDAMYGAIRTYHKMGHDAFHAEKQQLPERKTFSMYALTPSIVKSRATDRAPWVVPDWAQTVIAQSDINPSYAITTTVLAYGADQRCAVLWYGLFTGAPLPCTKEMSDAQKRKIIMAALSLVRANLLLSKCGLRGWIIDGGGSPKDTVIDFANESTRAGLDTLCSFGRGWKNYRPTGRHKIKMGEELHVVNERWGRRWIIYNADYWREIAQRSWTCDPLVPGACSLPAGSHDDFAAQVCREQLMGKGEIGGKMAWNFVTAPGPHDYGDCMHMAFVLAAVFGIGTAGGEVTKRAKRKAHVVLSRPSGRR